MKDIPLSSVAERFKLRQLCRTRGVALVLLALIVLGVYSRIGIIRQYDWMWSPDLVNQVHPWLELQAAAWRSGEFPLWDPYLWGGQPLLGQVQPGTMYPLNWLLYLLPARAGMIRYGFLDLYFVALHIMAASFAYALARGLGASRVASIAGGLLFSLAGFMGRVDWPQMANSALWSPLVLLAIFRAPRSTRPLTIAALGGLVLGISFLSGHHQVPIFLSIAAGALWFAQILRGGMLRTRVVAAAALFFVVAGLVAAVQVLPSIEYGREAVRWTGHTQPTGWNDPVYYYLHERFASKPHRLLGIVLPDNFEHYDHFLGFAGALLAVIGATVSLRRWEGRALIALGILSLILALGGTTAFHGLLYALVPMVEKARTPAAISALFTVAAATLAALGIDALLRRRADVQARAGIRTLTAVGALLFLFGAFLYFTNGTSFPTNDRFLLSALCAVLLAALLSAWLQGRISSAFASCALLVVLIAELSSSALLPFPNKLDSQRPGAYQTRFNLVEIVDYLRMLPGGQRGHVNGNQIAVALGDLHQVPMFEGFTASIPSTVWDLGMSQRRVLELYGVTRYISRDPMYPDQRQVAEFSNGFKAWELEGAFPRTWIAHQTESFDSVAAFRASFDEGRFAHTVAAPFVGQAPALPACGEEQLSADESSIIEYSLNRVVVQARTACGGLLVLSDNAFPGWKAYVNGRETEIFRPYHALRGIVLEPGEYRVEMHYRPMSFIVGAVLNILGLFLAAGTAWWERRRGAKFSHQA
jgi:hypothetical protein